MNKSVLQLVVLTATVMLVTLSACAAPTSTLTDGLTDDDRSAIYAAVARQLYTVDSTFGERPDFPIVYLVARNTRASESVKTEVVAALGDLPPEFVWVASKAKVPLDDKTGRVESGGAILTLTQINLQEDGAAHVYAEIYVGNLGRGGRTYVLERVEGDWRVVGDTGVLSIS